MLFVTAVGVLSALGALLGYGVHASGLMKQATAVLGIVPGGIGDLFLPFVYLAPWIVFVLLASVPWLMVRAARRKRRELARRRRRASSLAA